MRRATVREVRPITADDRKRWAENFVVAMPGGCTWVAIDSEGRQFLGMDEAEARQSAEDYNQPRRRHHA
jgi:hypothetical protein